jgi:short-subunit dehydrogenase
MPKKKVLITGGSSGIGAAFARAFAQRGYDLVLTGRRKDKLQAVTDRCRAIADIEVETLTAELTDMKQVEKVAAYIKENQIDILINNAGFGHNETFYRDSIENQTAMIDVHITATVRLTHAALSYMIAQKSGTIINVASVAGYVYAPGANMYCSTKAFLIAFSEILSMEHRKDGVRIQALCPGFTHTDFHNKIGLDEKRKLQNIRYPWMSSEKVISSSLKCLEKGKVVCVPGLFYWLAVKIVPRLPRPLYYMLFGRSNAQDSMFKN